MINYILNDLINIAVNYFSIFQKNPHHINKQRLHEYFNTTCLYTVVFSPDLYAYVASDLRPVNSPQVFKRVLVN